VKFVLCTVLDTVAGVYCRPFCARSNGEAQRIFGEMCKNDEVVSKCPTDYRLYRMGTFDEIEGQIESERPQQLMSGSGHIEETQVNGRKKRGGLRAFLGGHR